LNSKLTIAPVRKTLIVAATPERAFEVFTGGIDRWWPKNHSLGASPLIEQVIEPFVGGRWYSKHLDGAEIVIGHVLAWQPPQRFACTWEISADWKPDARASFASEVEVSFHREPDGRTRVELEHRHFERMGEAGGGKMRNEVDRGWPAILDLYTKALTGEGPT
jgi:uncharacterized protein YndB with AHSA1/START domain